MLLSLHGLVHLNVCFIFSQLIEHSLLVKEQNRSIFISLKGFFEEKPKSHLKNRKVDVSCVPP